VSRSLSRARSVGLLLSLLASAFFGCGGGSSSPTLSPMVSLSTTNLSFGTEVVGTISQPLTVTVTNSGTASLTVTTIAVSANFAQTNDCGSSLTAGANCSVNVTLSPQAAGTLSGTLTLTDNASGSPHSVSLSGTGVDGVPQDTLTGSCWGSITHGAPNQCGTGQDFVNCPPGQVAATPATEVGCLPPASMFIDTSTSCQFTIAGGFAGSGHCVTQASDIVGSCSVQGQECGAAGLPPCCSGLVCTPASTRAFCEPGESARVRTAPPTSDFKLKDALR
jgi:hypothetical protein